MQRPTKRLLTDKLPWKTFLWLYSALVLYATQKPINDQTPSWFPNLFIGIDKLVHFGMFAVMAFLIACAYKQRDIRVVVWAFMFGLAVEMLQFLLPFERSFDLWDLLANGLGALLGWRVAIYYLRQS